MTIKGSKAVVTGNEPEIVISAQDALSATDEEHGGLPVVDAVPVEPHNISHAQQNPHEVTADPIVIETVTPTSPTATGPTVVPTATTQACPPNTPPGGSWVAIRRVGPATWSMCFGISVVTCCCVLLPCGLWAFLCPCDQERAYLVNGKVFDEDGRMIGNARNMQFVR